MQAGLTRKEFTILKNYRYVLALDPSGSFEEGKGTTGWCLFDTQKKQILKTGWCDAKNFTFKEQYWDAHVLLIAAICEMVHEKVMVVIEDYVLYETKKDAQVNSKMETCKLIGIIQHYCWIHKIDYFMELASAVKNRWSNSILVYKKYILSKGNHFIVLATGEQVNRHAIDAIRHAVHFATFKNGKDGKNGPQENN
jgi:hypothetical protein